MNIRLKITFTITIATIHHHDSNYSIHTAPLSYSNFKSLPAPGWLHLTPLCCALESDFDRLCYSAWPSFKCAARCRCPRVTWCASGRLRPWQWSRCRRPVGRCWWRPTFCCWLRRVYVCVGTAFGFSSL